MSTVPEQQIENGELIRLMSTREKKQEITRGVMMREGGEHYFNSYSSGRSPEQNHLSHRRQDNHAIHSNPDIHPGSPIH